MRKDSYPFDVGQTNSTVAKMRVAAGNLCELGTIYTAV
jgi:hypothetical protein